MHYLNKPMQKFLNVNHQKILDATLENKLRAIIDAGFLILGEGIFLEAVYPCNYPKNELLIADNYDQYTDLSGFENSTNRLLIDNYIETDIYIQSFVFLAYFKNSWSQIFKTEPYIVVIGFQNDDVGKFANFTFHKHREFEVIYDTDNIESYSEPLYIEHINIA